MTRSVPALRIDSTGTTKKSELVVDEVEISISVSGAISGKEAIPASPHDPENLLRGVLFRKFGVLPGDVRITQPDENRFHYEVRSIGTGGYVQTLPGSKPGPKSSIFQPRFSPHAILETATLLHSVSRTHHDTGGVHVILYVSGSYRIWTEDISRHSAVDRLLGKLISRPLFPWPGIVMTSCRLTEDLLRRIGTINPPLVASVSAPSASAVDYAASRSITLCGFIRNGRLNVYSGFDRIAGESTAPTE